MDKKRYVATVTIEFPMEAVSEVEVRKRLNEILWDKIDLMAVSDSDTTILTAEDWEKREE